MIRKGFTNHCQITPIIQVFSVVLKGYSARQALAQMSLNSIKEYDGSEREVTILWLDHIKLVAKKMGIDPLKVGISKVQGTALGNINAMCKEGNLT